MQAFEVNKLLKLIITLLALSKMHFPGSTLAYLNVFWIFA